MEYLQESHLGDLMKIIGAVGKLITTTAENPDDSLINIIRGATNRKKTYQRSLTAQANKLIMTFPVLASNTLQPSTATMISKAIERKCTVMIQMLFAADLKVELKNGGGVENIINQYYNGIDFSNMTVDDMINVVEKVSPATYDKYFKETYTAEICKASIKAIMEKCYEEDISESSLNEYYIGAHSSKAQHDTTMVVNEAKKAPDGMRDRGLKMKDLPKTDIKPEEFTISDWISMDRNERDDFYQKYERKLKTAEFKLKDKRLAAELKKWSDEAERAKQHQTKDEKIAAAQLKNMEAQLRANRNDYFKKQLMDSDVKKANELVPSMLIVNYAIDPGVGKETIQSSAIVGIKTRLVPMDSFEIMQKLITKNKDKSGLVKFIRATTGEIKFIKDFIFAVDKAKVDALSKSKKGSVNPIWKVLERRSAVNNLRRALGQQNDASPITTLVITQEEVDYLYKESGMNINDISTANYILQSYNLMGLVIVDESTETAKFLFDGEFDVFDTLSFNSLEREAGDSNMYKKVINLMSKRM